MVAKKPGNKLNFTPLRPLLSEIETRDLKREQVAAGSETMGSVRQHVMWYIVGGVHSKRVHNSKGFRSERGTRTSARPGSAGEIVFQVG